MTKPNRLGMYADVRAILDAALDHGGGVYACDSNGAAVHWRQRAYKFRKLYAETVGESKYDRLTLPRIPPGGTSVVMELRKQVGTFIPNFPLQIIDEASNYPPTEDIDDLLAEALKLADRLGD